METCETKQTSMSDYQGFATSSQLCQLKQSAKDISKTKISLLTSVPLLSPLIFFSSRRSCASYSLSNSICSIWASIRSLEVSIFSPVIKGPSATLCKMKTEIQKIKHSNLNRTTALHHFTLYKRHHVEQHKN